MCEKNIRADPCKSEVLVIVPFVTVYKCFIVPRTDPLPSLMCELCSQVTILTFPKAGTSSRSQGAP